MANILHIKHLQRRLDAQDAQIICMAIHPGGVLTPNVQIFLNNRPPVLKQFFSIVLHMLFVPMRQGAMNSAHAAASPEVKAKAENFKGAYIDPVGKIVEASPAARDDRLGNELYDTTLEILKELKL